VGKEMGKEKGFSKEKRTKKKKKKKNLSGWLKETNTGQIDVQHDLPVIPSANKKLHFIKRERGVRINQVNDYV